MDSTRPRCGPDLGRHYVAVWEDKHKYHCDEQYHTHVFPLCCKQTPRQLTCEFDPAHTSSCDKKLALQIAVNRFPRLWITGNTVVNNVQFLAQTDRFAS